MSKLTISTVRQKELLAEVALLQKRRAATEQRLKEERQQRTEECQSGFDRDMAELKSTFDRELKGLDEQYVRGLETARHRFETESSSANEEARQRLERSKVRFRESFDAGELSWRQTRALTIDNFESEKRSAHEIGEQAKATLEGYEEQFTWLESEAEKMLKRRGVRFEEPPRNLNLENSTATLLKNYAVSARTAHEGLQGLSKWRSIQFLDDGWPLLIFFATFILSIFPSGYFLGWKSWQWLAVSGGSAAIAAVVSRQFMHFFVKARAGKQLRFVQGAVAEAKSSLTRAHVTIDREHQQRLKRLERRRDSQMEQSDATWKQVSSEMEREHEEKKASVHQKLSGLLAQFQTRWDQEAGPFRDEFPPRMEERKTRFANDSKELTAAKDKRLKEIQAEFEIRWDDLVTEYNAGINSAIDEIDSMRAYCRSVTPHFETNAEDYEPPTSDLAALPFGEFAVDLSDLEGGLSEDERMAVRESKWRLPSVLSFPDSPSLLIKATGEGRDEGVRVVRNVMLRMLGSFPSGKVRFTIIDPTGLGQNFSEFMHLADFDERLVTSRIWTESNHINKRLADLTEHMENVIQKYLRNEFDSIQDYNAAAGEIAEPFQVLVIANFPANCSEEAARRLVSIVSTGARCGVYSLIVADTKMSFPRNFDLQDLESHCNTLVWDGERMAWQDERLASFPLALDAGVEGDALTAAIRTAGEKAKDANRVEVPFKAVAPEPDDWWTGDSRHELIVPLGRAGATKLQELRLGKGTSQHVLIAGKTGSGKSTLMHALITNLALNYSPSEVEFCLVDFKKGVEFKTYSTFRLPHARVVAIESEREFGLSVLQRLDEELTRRGDLFREVGVQSVAGYREARPEESMPRQLLVVDEFQEFFVKDDKIASEASLLLDRLVRQGRAFGIHVLLGSQTLAGAYSLARSTLGQMAVRIALQCSESDAHLILSEDNTAARLLSRPGEAIYNNANGLFEGNHPFQVVWLPDSEREDYLKKVESLSIERGVEVPDAIVFEGSAPPDPAENGPLRRALSNPPTESTVAKAYLGSAIAIKEPTHIAMRRQSGANVLMVGQQEEFAAGVMSSALVSLAAHQPLAKSGERAARVIIMDGGGFESDVALGNAMQRRLPLDIETVAPASAGDRLKRLATEVSRRMESTESGEPEIPVYLSIFNLVRFRDLRKSDDDYGLGSFSDGEEMSPSKCLAHLLREGPGVGVHVLIWCDTYNNVTRWFERSTLRDISHRVLFQMSATDSSNLMDSAAASKLGVGRGIYYSDEQGETERFCPYDAPQNAWLDDVARLLRDDKVSV